MLLDTAVSWQQQRVALKNSAAQVAPLWFSAQWSFNASLSMTSVTSNTILASLASLFAFFGSVLCLAEQFTAVKLVFIALAVAGDPLNLKFSIPGKSITTCMPGCKMVFYMRSTIVTCCAKEAAW